MTTTCCNPTPNQQTAETQSAAVKPRYFVDGTQEAYEVRVELPGVAKDGVNINLEDNVLTLRAQRKPGALSEWKTLHRELSGLDYLLRLRLNAQVDEDKMSAALDQGVLTLKLPVREAAKPRRIEIQ
jgi:HSP20 family protein